MLALTRLIRLLGSRPKLVSKIFSRSAWSLANTEKSSTETTPMWYSLAWSSSSTPFLSMRKMMSAPALPNAMTFSSAVMTIAMSSR